MIENVEAKQLTVWPVVAMGISGDPASATAQAAAMEAIPLKWAVHGPRGGRLVDAREFAELRDAGARIVKEKHWVGWRP